MARPSRHICVVTLLATVLSLAACGSDPENPEAEFGEFVSAKSGVDTEGAPKAYLMLPSGRLDVRAGAPVDRLPEDATTERRARTAPEGGVFVPLTWTYSTASMAKLEPVFGQPLPVEMTLITDGEDYPLASPTQERDGIAADAYYVAVEGTGEDLTLEVEYAGETQTLDLVTGETDKGRAAGLYGLNPADYSEKLRNCPTADWIDFGPLVQITFACSRSDVVVAPFVDGEWAPKGKTYAMIGLTSTLSAYAVYDTTGSGATYAVIGSKEKSELDGKRPTRVISEKGETGFAAGFLVFTLDGKLPSYLTFHRTYQLQRSAILGKIDAPFERTLDISGRLPLS